MTRDEYLAWAKVRAHEYIDSPEPHRALTSLINDLSQRPDLENSLAFVVELGLPLAASGRFTDRNVLRKFVDDFD